MQKIVVKVIDLVPGSVSQIDTVECEALTGKAFIEDFVRKQRPVLIRGAARAWPAIRQWPKPGHIEDNAEDSFVFSSRMFNPLPEEPYFKYILKRRPLLDCIREMRGTEDDETFSIPAAMLPQSLERDFGSFPFFGEGLDLPPRMYPRDRVFLYKNAATEWHFHPRDETLTVQIMGSKRISLFAMSDDPTGRYKEIIQGNLHHLPCGDQFFPAEAPVTKFEGVMRAGDAVYIPPLWWHGIDPADRDIGATLAHCFSCPKPDRRWKSFFSRTLDKSRNAIERRFAGSKTAEASPGARIDSPPPSSAASISPRP